MLLTDNPYPYNPEPTPKLSNIAYNAFNAGAKAQLKKVVEWLIDLEKQYKHTFEADRHFREYLMQALLEEVKE